MGHKAVAAEAQYRKNAEPYAWYMLSVLVVVYVFNYIDRQLLTILAPDLKRDLGISDSDFGFLYGTAFGLFYALFGIPLGKLADRWSRVRLLTIGLSLWSVMTALSGFSRNFAQIAAARVGVGIGEATAAPCAYSLIGDYFPPHRRATALGIYSAGLFVGGGVSLFLGSSLAGWWDTAFAVADAPLGLAGWQAAFMMVGIPGLLVAAWVATLREPARGHFDGAEGGPPQSSTLGIWGEFFRELADIVPPFTLLGAAKRGAGALAANLGVAALAGFGVAAMVMLVGDPAQWIAVAIGFYAVFSWGAALRQHDRDVFDRLLKSRSFLGVSLAYGLVSFVGYANIAFTPLYAIQELGAKPTEAGLVIGSIGALGGGAGVIIGGLVADRLARHGDHARRVFVIAVASLTGLACHAVMFSSHSLPVYYTGVFLSQLFSSASLGGSAGTIVNIVPARFRGTATAAFLMSTNMLGLALGPYTGGKLSMFMGDLGTGMLALLVVTPAIAAALVVGYRGIRDGN